MKSSVNSKENKNNSISIPEKVLEYILSNLLSVPWNVSLLVGGIIFWLYFFQIQYFPDLNFDESILFLPVAAITGFLFLLLMASIFMTPYFFRWLMLLADEPVLAGKNGREGNKAGWGNIWSVKPANTKKNNKELLWYFISIYLIFLAYYLHYFKEHEFDFEKSEPLLFLFFQKDECVVFWILILLILAGHIYFYLWNSIKPWVLKKDGVKEKKATKGQDNPFILLVAWLFSSIMSVLPILFLTGIIQQTETNELSGQITLLIVFYFIVISVNLTFAYFGEQSKRKLLHWIIPFAGLICIFFMAKEPLIPKLVMNKFKFGHYTAQRLLVNAEGCKIINSLELETSFAKDQKTCHLKNIKILSRLGRSFYIEATHQCKPPWRCVPLRFTIPSKYVLSWTVPVPDKRNKAGKKEDSNP